MFALLKRAGNGIRKLLSVSGRSEPLDMVEIHRLREQRLSWREIAARLPGKPAHSIVFKAYRKSERAHPAPEPVHAVATPSHAPALPAVRPVEPLHPREVTPDSVGTALGNLRKPGPAARSPEPVPEPMPEPGEPFPEEPAEPDVPSPAGLDTVAGHREFFLVNGAANASLAHHMNQSAVGIERWDSRYWEIPAFWDCSRLWIVINAGEAGNEEFLRSIAADEQLRSRCVIAAPKSWHSVQGIAQSRMLAQREQGNRYSDPIDWEPIFDFQPMPPAGLLAPWLRKPARREPEFFESPLQFREGIPRLLR